MSGRNMYEANWDMTPDGAIERLEVELKSARAEVERLKMDNAGLLELLKQAAAVAKEAGFWQLEIAVNAALGEK